LAGLAALPPNDRWRLALQNSLGLVYTALGRFEAADSALREAFGLAERLGNPLFAARVLQNLGNNQSSSGLFDEAIASYKRAEALLETSGASAFDRANLAAALGTLYFWIKDLDMAEAVFKRADPVAL
ncbi:MAG TPA: tetratricopeptide repeat protein, partial [Anaerolineales bacterium]|nr:tetratricopeptide repeat protein [Anaerolineales bacterium]